MGYELDKIMRLYGVRSPTTVFSGVAPVAPTAPENTSPEKQINDYNALIAKYNEAMPRYLADKAAFDSQAARGPINPIDIYKQAQFGYTGQMPTLPGTVSPGALIPTFAPLAPLAYIGATPSQNAASAAPAQASSEGGGYASPEQSSFAGDPNSYSGGLLGSVLGFSSTPNQNVDVVDMGQATYGNTGYGAAPGYGVGSMAGINSMDAMSDAYGQNSGTTEAMSGGFGSGDTGGYSSGLGQDSGSSGAFGGGFGDSGDGGLGGTEGSGNSGGDNGADGGSDGGGGDGGSDGGDGGWARGGIVRRRFAGGGLNDLTQKYEVQDAGTTPAMSGGFGEAAPVAAAVAQPVPAIPGMPEGLAQMLSRYQEGPQSSVYGRELEAARRASTQEQERFLKMLESAAAQGGDQAPSKAEMYFRLAAAFGAPTRTGSFTESLGAAGKAMGEYSKEARDAERAARSGKMQLALEGQNLRMSGAKEDLNTLRTLAGEEMKDKRAVATKLLEQYIKSGEPESAAGKQAKDEGLRPGSPEFQARVAKIAENNVDKQMAQINATLANVSVAQANQALAQQRFGFQQEQAAKLTGPEVKLKTEAEDSLATIKGSMGILKRAFDLNKNSMGGSLVDKATRIGMEAAGSKDPVLLNTQELENLLTDQMISSAGEKMKGVLSDSDLKLLSQVSGAKSKNQEERKRIMLNAYGALQRGLEKQQKRLNEINQGLYRETSTPGGLE